MTDEAMSDDDVTPPAIAALGEVRAACPRCGNFAPYAINRGGYACAACGARFTDLAYFQRVPPPSDAA